MGNCSSKRENTDITDDDDDEETFLARSLLAELGIKLLQRPDGRELRALWQSFGEDFDGSLPSQKCSEFFRTASERWGDGTWGCVMDLAEEGGDVDGANSPEGGLPAIAEEAEGPEVGTMPQVPGRQKRRRRRSAIVVAMSRAVFSRAPPRSVSARLLENDPVSWEDVRFKLWEEPAIRGVSSSTVLALQQCYLQKLRQGGDGRRDGIDSVHHTDQLTAEEAEALAREVLRDHERLSHGGKERAIGSWRGRANISFLLFLRKIGPIYDKYMITSHHEGLRDKSHGDMVTKCQTINSFAPPREGTQTEILNCGEAVLTGMLNAVKSAREEVMLSFWEFCPTLPAIRGTSLGNDAWKDESTGERTLVPILKKKAEAGIKVFIIINDVTVHWALVDYTLKSLGSAHPNIHVMNHPDWRVWQHTHHQKFVVVDRVIAILGGVDWTVARWDLPSHPIFDPDSAIHPGLELSVNGKRFKKDISEYWTQPELDLTPNRGEHSCSLWQDVAVCVRGKAASDVALNFIQRWEYARAQYVFRHDRVYGDNSRKMPAISPKLSKIYDASEVNAGYAPYPLAVGGFPSPDASRSCKCQIVRSICDWSGGIDPPEISHYEAWISAINNAEQYIYCEQQYFVTNMGVGEAKNRVAEAILDRVQRAVELSKPFRIYIVIPATVYMTVVNYFTRRTLLQDGRGLKRREKSLMTRIQMLLRKAAPGSYWDGQTADSVLSVCFLSSIGRSDSARWEVGEVFVHSKVLIVDDKVAVIGSANVNDRSFIGTSDSELGAILWDDESSPDGCPNGCVKDFRLRLWRQYLGLSLDGSQDNLIDNPASEEAYRLWSATASENQKILSSVFCHFPSNSITSFSQYSELQEKYKKKTPTERAASLKEPARLHQVKGLVTKYPPKFLGDDGKRTVLQMLMGELPLPAYL